MNPDLSAFLAAFAEEIVFGQILVRRLNRGFALRHVADREAAEEDITKATYDLLEFDRMSVQGTNDGPSLRYRFDTMRKHLKELVG